MDSQLLGYIRELARRNIPHTLSGTSPMRDEVNLAKAVLDLEQRLEALEKEKKAKP
jgi:hypothetical protein